MHGNRHADCDQYCQGEGVEVKCEQSGDALKTCIKACLDCKSPHAKKCHCPSIYPPIIGAATSPVESNNNRPVDDYYGNTEEDDGIKDKGNKSVHTGTILVIAGGVVVAILVFAVCLCMVLMKRKKGVVTYPVASVSTMPSQVSGYSGYSQPNPVYAQQPAANPSYPGYSEPPPSYVPHESEHHKSKSKPRKSKPPKNARSASEASSRLSINSNKRPNKAPSETSASSRESINTSA